MAWGARQKGRGFFSKGELFTEEEGEALQRKTRELGGMRILGLLK